MTLAQRGRSLAVVGFLAAGSLVLLSASQTWLQVERTDAGEPILVTGSQAFALLTPLGLAVLALGAVLALAGRAMRFVIASLGLVAALGQAIGVVALLAGGTERAVGPAVTEVTGLAGSGAVDAVASAIIPTAWPITALVAFALLAAAAVFALVTAPRWKTGGRRYRTADAVPAAGPVDAVDSWDELSRGTDPTTGADRLKPPHSNSEDLP